jgi:cell wall-associated NlpC family hydrolase
MQPIPLSPPDGAGQCISDSALDTADIIVSAGQGIVAGTIRLATSSDISHASLYDGDGGVIEAVGEGVRQVSLEKALAGHTLAVAYRVRGMTDNLADSVVDIASSWLNKKYDTLGAAGAGARNPVVCVYAFGIAACPVALAGGFKSSDKFYCSQLVLEAYRRAGVPFIAQNPKTSQPQDLVNAYSHGKLLYVGHLVIAD